MIKQVITYQDYEGEEVQKTFYFHLNKFEWVELQAYTKGGFVQNLKSSVETDNTKKTIDLLKKIIRRAYGEKDPETNEFVKSDAISDKFLKSEAFSTLFFELMNDEAKSNAFFMGLVPPDMRNDVTETMEKEKLKLME